ncbi:hypothetical protein FRC16_005773 [Serendipita sp. 398]|nr:hypothetical protein FRC16_005773 [Serendipita sp. 398]
MPNPDLQHGLDYWAQQEASIDGVLGGYGNGSLPRVDALSSRLFLLSVLPNLCKTPSPLRKLGSTTEKRRFRALDAGESHPLTPLLVGWKSLNGHTRCRDWKGDRYRSASFV